MACLHALLWLLNINMTKERTEENVYDACKQCVVYKEDCAWRVHTNTHTCILTRALAQPNHPLIHRCIVCIRKTNQLRQLKKIKGKK